MRDYTRALTVLSLGYIWKTEPQKQAENVEYYRTFHVVIFQKPMFLWRQEVFFYNCREEKYKQARKIKHEIVK